MPSSTALLSFAAGTEGAAGEAPRFDGPGDAASARIDVTSGAADLTEGEALVFDEEPAPGDAASRERTTVASEAPATRMAASSATACSSVSSTGVETGTATPSCRATTSMARKAGREIREVNSAVVNVFRISRPPLE
ncbi:hypothetical protein [Myxococcus landrumensis]|uniref:Uncharacterized protein n=1 Tax=Myxococcus landrumensis TaxID=2813577 RepID=A0ABX7N9G5_9BACT|nr:hypothetical protein [Myxococcus landrumus]QSQ15420.1 hypothetical protein JY572_04905 [Myxococcus landrumus]